MRSRSRSASLPLGSGLPASASALALGTTSTSASALASISVSPVFGTAGSRVASAATSITSSVKLVPGSAPASLAADPRVLPVSIVSGTPNVLF